MGLDRILALLYAGYVRELRKENKPMPQLTGSGNQSNHWTGESATRYLLADGKTLKEVEKMSVRERIAQASASKAKKLILILKETV